MESKGGSGTAGPAVLHRPGSLISVRIPNFGNIIWFIGRIL
jgi:hypothetical protein